MKKSVILENADKNITCNFGGGDIRRLGVTYLIHAIHTYVHNYLNYIKMSQTCVVFPEPVSPETRITRLSFIALTITSFMWATGRLRRNALRSDAPRSGGTWGTPLFKRPVVVRFNSLPIPVPKTDDVA